MMFGGIALIAAIAALSLLFFLLWQYIASPWLIVGYILAVLAWCTVVIFLERRKHTRIFNRLEQVLAGKSADFIADEGMSPVERRLILYLNQLEAREAKVQNSYQSISSLVADIAHQSKTPLSSILMYTEMMDNTQANVIRTQTERLRFLMESLTKLAKCEGGLIEENLSLHTNSVHALIKQVIGEHFPAADAKNIAIRCDLSDALYAVFDMRWTAEAVGNILDNAIKYSPNGSEIVLTACAYDLFVKIDISDRGSGIPEEELTNIWKRFYRGKNAEKESGVGIGLYLTACILRAEGGRVLAKSSPDGSTFSVFLSKL